MLSRTDVSGIPDRQHKSHISFITHSSPACVKKAVTHTHTHTHTPTESVAIDCTKRHTYKNVVEDKGQVWLLVDMLKHTHTHTHT